MTPALRNAARPGCRVAVLPVCPPPLSSQRQAGRTAPRQAGGAALRGHRSAAGFRYANPGTPVQLRLTAPFSHGERQLAQQSLQNSAGPGPHRIAVPFSPGGLRSIGGPLPCKQQTPERNRQAPPIIPEQGRAALARSAEGETPSPQGECPGQRTVNPPSSKRPEGDAWRTTTIPHQSLAR